MNRLSKNEEKIKQTLNSQKFEYNPAHWKAVEKTLNAKGGIMGLKFNAIWLTLPILVVFAGIIRWAAPETSSLAENKANNVAPLITEKSNTTNSDIPTLQSTRPTISALPQAESKKATRPYPTKNEAKTKHTKHITAKKGGSTSINNVPLKKENSTPIDIEKPEKQLDNLPPNTTLTTSNNEVAPTNSTTAPTKESTNIPKTTTDAKEKELVVNIPKKDKEELTPENKNTAPSNPPVAKKDGDKKEKQEHSKTPKQILIKNTLAVVAGTNYSKLLETSGNNYINTPHFGLQYQYQLNPKWQFNTGLGYSYVNASGLEKKYTTQQYAFGLTTESTTINTKRLHYIELPVVVRYAAFNNFSFVGGTNITYLLNTNSTVNTSTVTTLGGKQTPTQSNENQYKKGINQWDVQLQFGLEYKLNNNLHMGLLANTGLLDVSRNNYYNTTVFNLNSRLQLYIKYDFIRF